MHAQLQVWHKEKSWQQFWTLVLERMILWLLKMLIKLLMLFKQPMKKLRCNKFRANLVILILMEFLLRVRKIYQNRLKWLKNLKWQQMAKLMVSLRNNPPPRMIVETKSENSKMMKNWWLIKKESLNKCLLGIKIVHVTLK